MPSLGADMEAGTVVEWLVKPGDVVHKGDVVAVVDTDKADIDIETFEGGTVGALLVPVGRTRAGRHAARDASSSKEHRHPHPHRRRSSPRRWCRPPGPHPPRAPLAAPRRRGRRPLARCCAASPGTWASTSTALHGTGPGGAVTRDDIEAAAAAPHAADRLRSRRGAPTAARGTDQQLAMRHAIANLMSRSAREIPHYHLATEIDLARPWLWLERTNLDRPVHERLIPAVLLMKAVATAATRYPDLNGFWLDGAFRPADAVHLGVAISLRSGGLVAPAIHDADDHGPPDADGGAPRPRGADPTGRLAAPRCRTRR